MSDFKLQHSPAECPAVTALLAACPFLADGEPDRNSPALFAKAARLIMEQQLSAAQEDQVFEVFNRLAETGSPSSLDILSTEALEMFNDTPEASRLARQKLNGRALELVEEMRLYWVQPDYSA